jgi:hypothetical protein
MRRLPPFEQKLRSQIRDELAIKPVFTMAALKERIEEVFGRGFDYEYTATRLNRSKTSMPTRRKRRMRLPHLSAPTR